MRRLDDHEIDPEIAAQLDAIDATLAGDPVDPEHAELAELALLLRSERSEPAPEFARSLDGRVARRFAKAPAEEAERRRWMWEPLAGVLAAVCVAAVLVVVIGPGGGTSSDTSSTASVAASAGGAKAPAALLPREASHAAASASGSATTASPATAAPQPPNNGRKIIQSAQLALTTPASRVETVAQEAFQVIGRENGIVDRSTVTATGGSDGYANFQLRVPSGNLSQTMSALSTLQYAHVSSRTDNTQDVNDTYVSVTHRLADSRALRTALLKQLANATTQQQIDSLNARIHDAEASIASDEATIRGLNRRINFSDITLTINAGSIPTPVSRGSSGFTIGKAAHDAGRVLTVAAGVALIALAALVPVALLVALGLWVGAGIRRRRREQALDAA
jgi:Domain of unknown function (DUF4349)